LPKHAALFTKLDMSKTRSDIGVFHIACRPGPEYGSQRPRQLGTSQISQKVVLSASAPRVAPRPHCIGAMTKEESKSHPPVNEDGNASPSQPECRIARFMRASQVGKVQIPDQELQRLKAAAQRLDQLLAEGRNLEVQALREATARLDRLLEEVAAGQDLTSRFTRRSRGTDFPSPSI